MTEPDPRFEVPPDYTQVYESTYRRASAHDDELEPLDRPVEPGSIGPRPAGRWSNVDPRRLLRGRAVLIATVVCALVLVGLVSFGLGRVGRPASSTPSTAGEGNARLSSSAPRLVAIHPEQAVSSCATPTVSGPGGRPLRLGPSKALDDDAATAWACAGSQAGAAITMTLPAGATLARVEVVPATSVLGVRSDRVDSIEWILNGAPPIEQSLDSRTSRPQAVNLSPVSVRTVVLRLTSVSPGPADLAAIASIRLWGPPTE